MTSRYYIILLRSRLAGTQSGQSLGSAIAIVLQPGLFNTANVTSVFGKPSQTHWGTSILACVGTLLPLGRLDHPPRICLCGPSQTAATPVTLTSLRT